MKHTRRDHTADRVVGPAVDGAVVHLGVGSVRQRAPRTTAVVERLRQCFLVGGVVECPAEGD